MNLTIGQRRDWRSAFGQLLRGSVGVLIALLVVRSWFLEPFVVPSGSMAPTLLGVHTQLDCARCGSRIVYGLDDGPAGRVLCPNCSHVQLEPADLPVIGGDRVLVDRCAFRWRHPRRWEPIAFRSPSKARDIVVKRVVGLPGETVEIRDGDVYANGQIQRKSLAEHRALAIPVHDAACDDLPFGRAERWRPDAAASRWRRTDGRFSCSASASGPDPSARDWLTYHHQRIKPGSSTENEEAPVTDSYVYNQTQSRRELFPVRDLALSCRLRATGSGQIVVVATDGAVEFWLRLDLQRQHAELLRDGTRVASAPCEFPGSSSEGRLYLSLIDEQVCVAWNDELLLGHPYERPANAGPASSRPFRIAAVGVELDVWNLHIDRDIYYTPPLTAAALGVRDAQTRLGPGEYFVLGDNSPQSRDSRWSDFGPGIPESLLIGKPLVVYYPARVVHAGGRSFQVPEFSNIRYIR
jgi:signal peptidase I